MLYRIVSSGSTRGIRLAPRGRRRAAAAAALARGDRGVLPRAAASSWRVDASNAATKRGLIRERILPLLEELDPRARANLLALGADAPRLPRRLEASLVELLSSRDGTRVPPTSAPGSAPCARTTTLRLEGTVSWGPWRLESDRPGLVVRSRRPGDRLAGRARKVQDVLVDAKVPRDERDDWPLVATDDGDVVAVAGLAEAPGWEGAVRAVREDR